MTKRVFKDKAESIITDLLKTQHASLITKTDHSSGRYIRAILPPMFEARPNDKINYGIAFKIHPDKKIELGPYLYRIVCENGVIVSHERLNQELDIEDMLEFEIGPRILDAMEKCCTPITFETLHKYVMAATFQTGNLRHIFHRLSNFTQWSQRTSLYNHIVQRLDAVEQPSRYDLMNAITSLARDTFDQEMKWNLQKLGWTALAGIESSWNGKKEYTETNEEPTFESKLELDEH